MRNKNYLLKSKKMFVFLVSLIVLVLVIILSWHSFQRKAINEASAAQISKGALFVLNTEDKEGMNKSIEFIKSHGGRVTATFQPHILFGSASDDMAKVLGGKEGIERVEFDKLDPVSVKKYGEEAIIAVKSWNLMVDNRGKSTPPIKTSDIKNDALKVPDEFQPKESEKITALNEGAPYGANFYDTSEYLTGRVTVGVILPESDGSIDPNVYDWDPGREGQIVTELVAGMSWWGERVNTRADIIMSFLFIYGRTDARAQTSYEPVSRPADPSGTTGESLWVNEIMDKMGYSSYSNRFDKVRAWLNDLRDANGTPWAMGAFVVNSGTVGNSAYFTDNRFAYQWIGGPYMVMTYGNNGWGPTELDSVSAHEMGHAFYAFDEYNASGCTCSESQGYLNWQNQNCDRVGGGGGGCAINVDSIMRTSATAYANGVANIYTQGQVGIIDRDSDGIPDVVDTKPRFTRISVPSITSDTTPTITGGAAISPKQNLNSEGQGHNIDLNTISNVQYKVDGGSWKNASSSGNSFSGSSDDFNFTPSLSKGRHTIQVRAQNSWGNWSDTSSHAITIGTVNIVTMAGYGGGAQTRFFNVNGNLNNSGFFTFPSWLRSGARIATGDVDKDGQSEIITGSGIGMAPHVTVWEKDGTKRGIDFRPFPYTYRGGVDVTAIDVDGDGKDEIAMSQFHGEEAWVKVYRYNAKRTIISQFRAFGAGIRSGATVSAVDVNGDSKEELVVGAGEGGGPQILVFNPYTGRVLKNFFAFHPNSRTGVDVSAYRNSDGGVRISATQLFHGEAWTKVYNYANQAVLANFRAFPQGVQSGANIDMYDLDTDGTGELLLGPNIGGGPQVRGFEPNGSAINTINFFAYSKSFRGGVSAVGGLM